MRKKGQFLSGSWTGKICGALAALFAVALIASAGGDPWKSKPFQQWSEGDVKTIFESSPWARPNLQPSGAWRPLGSGTTSGVGVFGRSTDVADGGASKEKDATGKAQIYTVMWWSSRTIRAASVRKAVIHGTMTAADAEKMVADAPDEFQIYVGSTNMSIFEKRGEKAFMDAAYLETKKSKQQIAPKEVTFQRNADDKVVGVIFHFPKNDKSGEPLIARDEKEVDFFLRVADARLNTDFDPRKMVDSKGPDL
jgi:hypothetical protein